MKRIIFMYWGRRGLSKFTLDLLEASARQDDLSWNVSISRSNEDYDRFLPYSRKLMPIRTFERSVDALLKAGRIRDLRRQLVDGIRATRAGTVVNLMPHVWSPFVIRAVQDAGARYVTLLHDAQRHPGDRSGLAHRLLLMDAERADHIVTLSQAVTDMATDRLRLTPSKITTLFHPHLSFDSTSPLPAPKPGEPWRLLSMGRIMAYKGLPLLVEAMEQLRATGFPAVLDVMGAGDLGGLEPRLRALGGGIVNRWLTEEEIAAALRNHHAVVLSHVEASQSGVAATALGAGVPVISFATGGLTEQIDDGRTGLLAGDASATALAHAVRRLAEPKMHDRLVAQIAADSGQRSMAAFLRKLLSVE